MKVVLAVPYMTAEKYAEFAGLTELTVKRMMDNGHIPSVKKGKRRLVNVVEEMRAALGEVQNDG
ncbi:DNA-binding protein [Bermanella marisrubri]|uniref:Helix-turn-helix domain-containing protein n=1 Tax=Bermanella marisrubri TaxID=207949 RepID=Q1N4R0_9GAMM|nr:helix-turn-helix domain-containing protein [Bermanella marisrubri]EAT13368.1 hypothetical protein RED65_01370 [Oceanobacter sp. RED65] [Bermanella marisrubri]QIZ84123.1 DNA-binding protein [Bermanella marisrubri]